MWKLLLFGWIWQALSLGFVGLAGLAVGRGRHAHHFAEDPQKAGIVIESAVVRHFVQRLVRVHHGLGQQHPAVEHIVIHAAAGVLHKLVGEEGHAHSKLARQGVQLQRLGVMIVDVGQDLMHGLVHHDGLHHFLGALHGAANDLQEVQKLGIVGELTHRGTGAQVGLQFLDQLLAGQRVLLRHGELQLAAGVVLAEEVLQVQVTAATVAQHGRGDVEEGALVIHRRTVADQAVHAKRRHHHQLIGLQGVHVVVQAVEPGTADVDIQLVEVMAVEVAQIPLCMIRIAGIIVMTVVCHGGIRGLQKDLILF